MEIKLLSWQERMHADYKEKITQTDYVVVAGPGSGKTIAAAICAKHTWAIRGSKDLILVVVPYRAIKDSWVTSFKQFGMDAVTDPTKLAEDTEIIITTYAGARGVLDYIVKELVGRKLIIVFDEFHHMEETNTWASPFLELSSEIYVKRLFLSGTPWHETGQLTPFVQYDENDEAIADFTYSYGENVNSERNEKNTVEIKFYPKRIELDIPRHEEESGITRLVHYDTDKTNRGDSIAPFVHFDDIVQLAECKGIISLIHDGVKELERIRTVEVHNAGGIIFVPDVSRGKTIQLLMQEHFNKDAKLIYSDDPKSAAAIKAFRQNSAEWIIAIDMISEGVDIPRLKVGVDITNRMTLLHIIQRWMRIVRLLRDEYCNPSKHNTEARLFFMGHAQLKYVAEQIEDDLRKHRRGDEGGPGEPPPKVKYGAPSQSCKDLPTIFKGKTLEEQIEKVADWIIAMDFNRIRSEELGYKGALNLARFLVETNNVPDEIIEEEKKKHEVEPVVISKEVKKQEIVDEYTKITNRIAERYFDKDYETANRHVNRQQGVRKWTRNHKTAEQLAEREKAAGRAEKALQHARGF